MAGALSAFKEALSSYKSNLVDYLVYSFIACALSAVLSAIMFAWLLAAGVVLAGNIENFFVSGIFDTGIIISVLALAVILVAFLIVAWLFCGVAGAYCSAVNAFILRRKQTIAGFFHSVPKYASRLFVLLITVGILIFVPAGALSFISYTLSFPLSIAPAALAAALAALICILSVFCVPAVVADNKSAVNSIKTSVLLSAKNFLGVIIFAVISCLLLLPNFLIIIAPIYIPFFYFPVITAALLLFYRGAR